MWKCILKNNQKGFTLVESLMALVVNALVLLLVTGLFQTLYHVSRYFDIKEKNIEWHVFLNQVENDLEDKEILSVQRNEVQLKVLQSKEKVTYKPWGATLRRYRNETGYVPMLTKTKNTTFSKNANGFSIQTDFVNGQTMRGAIALE